MISFPRGASAGEDRALKSLLFFLRDGDVNMFPCPDCCYPQRREDPTHIVVDEARPNKYVNLGYIYSAELFLNFTIFNVYVQLQDVLNE